MIESNKDDTVLVIQGDRSGDYLGEHMWISELVYIAPPPPEPVEDLPDEQKDRENEEEDESDDSED